MCRLDRAGYMTVLQNGTCHIKDPWLLVATATMRSSGFYELDCQIQTSPRTEVNACWSKVVSTNTGAETKDPVNSASLWKWHRRLGHRDSNAIKRICSEKLATGICVNKSDQKLDCECCALGKLSARPFPISTTHTKRPLDLIHSDVCGPMSVQTPSGNRYMVTLIDDYSRFTITKLIKSRAQVYHVIKDYIAYVTTMFGRRPSRIRTDNGREYVSKGLTQLFQKLGIHHELTVPYTPQQNGVAERKNRALCEMARCLLLDASMPRNLWGEAVLHATYLQNRLPSRSVEKTPFEHFSGEKPDLAHLRIFGSKVFAHIPREKRSKWDNRAFEGQLLGWSDTSKAYRVLNPKSNKVTLHATVRVMEHEYPRCNTNFTSSQEDYDDWAKSLHEESLKSDSVLDDEESHSNSDFDASEESGESSIRKDLFEVHDPEYGNNSRVNEIETASPKSKTETLTPGKKEPIETLPAPLFRKRGRPKKELYKDQESCKQTGNKQSLSGEPPLTTFTVEQENEVRRFARLRGEDPPQHSLQIQVNYLKEPSSWNEMISLPPDQQRKWREAADKEMLSLKEHEVWVPADLPSGRTAISTKWVFRQKVDGTGKVIGHKARLVARGFSQKLGFDYQDTYSPVV